MIKYDLYSAVSTIYANLNKWSGVRLDKGAFGKEKSSSIEASERGERWDWDSGVIRTLLRAALSFGRRSDR